VVTAHIRLAHFEDLDAIVDLHMRAFPGFFLTILGRRFLSEVYRGFLRHGDALVLIAELNGTVAGFAAGTLAPERFFRSLLFTRWFAFGWAAVGAAVRHPHAVIPRLLSGLYYRGERPPRLMRAALLSSIAVEPNSSRSGIGAMLLTAYCEQARLRGLKHVYLTTDQHANEGAIRFYARHGFNAESAIRRGKGRTMIRYVSALIANDPPSRIVSAAPPGNQTHRPGRTS
jgi:ribosomal protein S18 acetylase RimI-like enzyme